MGSGNRRAIGVAVGALVVILAGQAMAYAYDRLTTRRQLPGKLDLVRTHPSLAALGAFLVLMLIGFLVARAAGRRADARP